ncbi:hypothetical protein SEA_ZOOMAN_44 [Microbacterium phage Zooman]|nr:hypothetical protein SEA_ZOOMAN_44 [Microbacterium phage Zooman]
MADFQWSDPYQVMMVTEEMNGRHPRHVDYPLLPGDSIQLYTDGTWAKVSPGLMVAGFVLSEEDVQTRMKAVWMQSANLAFHVLGDVEEADIDIALTQAPEVEGYDL